VETGRGNKFKLSPAALLMPRKHTRDYWPQYQLLALCSWFYFIYTTYIQNRALIQQRAILLTESYEQFLMRHIFCITMAITITLSDKSNVLYKNFYGCDLFRQDETLD